MGLPAKSLLIAALGLAAGACGSGPENPRSKRIYSVLEAEEYSLRQLESDHPYVYRANALRTEHSTIAFPITGGRREYIVFLANPKVGEGPYSVPSSEGTHFALDAATYREIVAKNYVTSPLQAYLRRYVTDGAERADNVRDAEK